MKNPTTDFISEILRIQEEPPRQVKYLEVLHVVFKEKSQVFMFFFGLIMGLLFLSFASNTKPSGQIIFNILFAILVLMPWLITFVPFYYAYRLFNAIRVGKILSAKVETVEFLSQNLQNTLDAIENGVAQGTWRLPNGQLTNFQIDKPWAKGIKVGSHIKLLCVSLKPNGIFPLHLLDK